MALPYVPVDDVEDIFNRLVQQADQNAALQNLLEKDMGERHGSTAIDGIQPLGLFIEGWFNI